MNLVTITESIAILGGLGIVFGIIALYLEFRSHRRTETILQTTLEQNQNLLVLYEEILLRRAFEDPERAVYFNSALNQLSGITSSLESITSEIRTLFNKPQVDWAGSCSERDKIDAILSILQK